MANADIVPIGFDELPLVTDLFNEVFRPGRGVEFFERRLQGRHNALILLAQVEKQPAGFAVGYELKPSTFYCWLIGVLSDYRRAGVATQIMEAMAAWAADNEYQVVRFECFNQQRPMLHLAITQGYDVVGVRYDADSHNNLIILEQTIGEDADE
jgi:GNAT superfamily N-acetyltransferase